MNTKILLSVLLIFWLLGSLAVRAEEAPCVDESFDFNYRFALTYISSENEEHELKFVSAARKFTVTNANPEISIDGRIIQIDKSSLVLEYNLRMEKQFVTGSFTQYEDNEQINPFQTVARRNGGLRSSVRLRFGKPVIILESDQESVRLEVAKVD